MRILILLLLIATILSACSSSGATPNNSAEPIAAFAAFPRPSELASGTDTVEPATKIASNVIAMDGGSFTETPPSSNVNRVGNECWLYGQTLELTYAYYELAGTVLQGSEYFTHVLAELDWETGFPDPPLGLYIGMPDYEHDTWCWLGPWELNAGWVDISELNLRGNVGVEHIIVVAFCDDHVIVDRLAFQHTSLDHTAGNEWLYYEHETPDVPGAGMSISRARPDGSEIEHLHGGTETASAHRPVISTRGGDRLAYGYYQGDRTEIWRSELDGSAPTQLLAVADEDVMPVGWHPQGLSMLFLRRGASTYWDLWARDIDAGVNGLLYQETNEILEAIWDTSNDYRFSAIVSLLHPNHDFYYIWNEGPLPVTEPPIMVYETPDGCSDTEPAPYLLCDCTGGVESGFVFTHFSSEQWVLFRYPAASDAGSFPVFYLESIGYALHEAAVSPDGTRIAMLQCERGEYEGTLLVTDFLDPDLDTAVEIAQNVRDVIWYDPDY